MKNRRIAIFAFLLVASLVMGIAYAALTDNLFIKGEATLATTAAQTTFDGDVYFSNAAVLSTTGTSGVADTATIGATDNDSATFAIKSLGNKGESVTFAFTITNESPEFDAEISLDATFPSTTDATNFSITYSIEEGVTNVGPVTCPKNNGTSNGTCVVYVTVTLLNTPQTNLTAAFNVNLTATSK